MSKVTIFALVMVGVVSCGMCVGGNKETQTVPGAQVAQVATVPEKPPAPDPTDLLIHLSVKCERAVKESLHDPDSAEFDDFGTHQARKVKGNTYVLPVGVRARNAFNAVRRAEFRCVASLADNRWTVLEVKQVQK